VRYLLVAALSLTACGEAVANNSPYEPAERGTQETITPPPLGWCFYNDTYYQEGEYEIVGDYIDAGTTQNQLLPCRPFVVEIITPPTVQALPETK